MSQATQTALYGKLAGDGTLTGSLGTAAPGYGQSIYYEEAPTQASFPYVILQKQAGTPIYGLASTTVMNDEIWLIKGVDRSESSTVVNAIQARLDALLTDGTLNISGKTQLYLRRESDLDYSENQDGVLYRHAGSLFRLTTV